MHRRLSLAVLLLGASLCGMEKEPSETSVGAKQALATLVELAARAAQLADFSDGIGDADRFNAQKQDGEGSERVQQSRMRGYSISRAGCLAVLKAAFPVIPAARKTDYFPNERGGGFSVSY